MEDKQGVRINKYIAQCGYCSRRDADKLIEISSVMVNGQPAVSGMKVTDKDDIRINGKPLGKAVEKVVLAYYKPLGVVCTERDKHARMTVKNSLKHPERLTYAGRLDKESEGLLIMTNDGYLIDAMMRGANKHEKEYVVKVNKPLTKEAIEYMSKGVYLKDLDKTTRECDIIQTGPYTMRMILTQGLNRQIRRMCQAAGYEVKGLIRTRVMNIQLGKMKAGEYRELSGEELRVLYELCSL